MLLHSPLASSAQLKSPRQLPVVMCRGKLAGFGEEDAAKKQTEGVRRTIPKIENTFNAEEYSRKKRNR